MTRASRQRLRPACHARRGAGLGRAHRRSGSSTSSSTGPSLTTRRRAATPQLGRAAPGRLDAAGRGRRAGRRPAGRDLPLRSERPATSAPAREVEPDRPSNRLNDACTDPAGRIWFGTMDDGEKAETGRFYVFDRGQVTRRRPAPVSITNGPAVSPDGSRLYFTDTLGQIIHVAESREDGSLGPAPAVRRASTRTGPGLSRRPDRRRRRAVSGPACTRAGRRGATRPTAARSNACAFPPANITKLAFGGEDLRTVYATTAAKGLDAEELAAPAAGGQSAVLRGPSRRRRRNEGASSLMRLGSPFAAVRHRRRPPAPRSTPVWTDHAVIQRGAAGGRRRDGKRRANGQCHPGQRRAAPSASGGEGRLVRADLPGAPRFGDPIIAARAQTHASDDGVRPARRRCLAVRGPVEHGILAVELGRRAARGAAIEGRGLCAC